MAGALRPTVLLMALASLLFFVAGALDGIYPGGERWSLEAYGGLGWTSYAFGLVNAVVAVLIARGSERVLVLRIGLAALFVVERTVSAFVPSPRSDASIGVHLATAALEGVILFATWRVWRFGHVTQTDLSFLSISARPPLPAGAAAGAGVDVRVVPVSGAATAADLRKGLRARPSMAARLAPRLSRRLGWAIGVLVLLLAGLLVADEVAAGVVPGLTADLPPDAGLAYLFALVILAVSLRAVHGHALALRLLVAVALILFIERAFTPFVIEVRGAASLGLHVAAALVALVLALASVVALRSVPQA